MKIIQKIPQMTDNELAKLFQNAQDWIYKGKAVDDAAAVISAIEREWEVRLKAYRKGQYKAETPPEGVLKAIGYKVGNDGLPEAKRQQLLDFAIQRILPPVGSPAYMAEWGPPCSLKRYRKLHRVIRVLASSAKTLGNMDVAASDWEDDLIYIEQKWRAECSSDRQ